MIVSIIPTPLPLAPDDFLPLKPVDLQILLALSETELHGYGLTQAIARQTEGVVTLEPGNLYRVVKRQLAEGLVAESDLRVADDSGERRRYYRITPLGSRVLAAELSRLRQVLASATARAVVKRWAT